MTSSPDSDLYGDASTPHPLEAFGAVGEQLLRTLAAERLSPAYLFEGTDSESLMEAALAFAAGILSRSPPGPRDERIFRLASTGAHPDLHILTKDKATVISVKALAPVLERAHATPLECAFQVFLIHPAEAMEPEGIARYLKTLEEPPGGTVFILVSTRPDRLPDTVLSRCRRTRFPPLADSFLMARLSRDGLEEDAAREVCRYAGGSLVRARRLTDCAVVALAADLTSAATAVEPRVEQAAADALAHVQREAAKLAAADSSESDTKRQYVRVLLADVLRVLCIEARDRAAGRDQDAGGDSASGGDSAASGDRASGGDSAASGDRGIGMLSGATPETALDLLSAWGALEAAVAANVTPAVILLEAVAAWRRDALSS